MTLLNSTNIAYRHLTIPACRTCNSHHLAPLERTVKRATARGPSAVRRLTKRTLFLWLSKIFYGILYKEGLLRADRADPHAGRLVPRPLLESFRTHHFFLQGVRIPMRFGDAFPASILVYRLQKPSDRRYHFNFRDLPGTLAVAIQLGSVGILAALQDGGSQEKGFGTYLGRYHQFPLHPLQFLELVASFFYKSTLFNRNPKYVTIESTRALEVVQLPLQGFSARPTYDDWDQARYAELLAFHTRIPVDQIFTPPDKVMTWLNGPDGKPRMLDIRRYPWP